VFALSRVGFRRYSTYRQATVASIFTNSVFGFLHCYVLLAATAATGHAGGYTARQLVLYVWAVQGLLGVVVLWGWTELGDRIRTGDVVVDLLRPVHPVTGSLAEDLGRAGFATLTRFVVPLLVGALTFDMYVPLRVATYPLFVVSAVLAVMVSFGVRYLINSVGFWLLDVRGVTMFATGAIPLASGLGFPLHFLPSWVTWTLWVCTPFPSMMQAPLDVLVERQPVGSTVGVVAGQAVWAVVLLGACRLVTARAERRLVVQGG
jgi:ABC-2 type transport system permease protein